MSYLFSTSYFHFCFLGEYKDKQFSVFLNWSNDGVWVLIAPYRPGSIFWVCSWCSYFNSSTSHKASEPQMVYLLSQLQGSSVM